MDQWIVPPRILIALGLLLAVLALGEIGYIAIEHFTAFQAFYMTVTTLSTVGGGEAHPLSDAGRWLTIGVIIFGVGVMTYTLLTLVEYVLEGQLAASFGSRRMRSLVRRMTDHFILCGYGRVGTEIAREFVMEGVPFVIIDVRQDSLTRAARDGHLVVAGDAADVDTLKEARVERARGLIAAMDSDADNLFVTLSARVLRPNLFIVARANRPDSEPKLRLAGANRTISPYTIGGKRMASLAMRPTAVEFVDTVLSAENSGLLLEDITIPSNSPWCGRSIVELTDGDEEIAVLALKRAGQMHFRPNAKTVLTAGDELVVAGPAEPIRTLERRL